MTKAHQVYICRKRTGCCKHCPQCKSKNAATAKVCCKCNADLRQVKRSYDGKGFVYSIKWYHPRTGKSQTETVGPDKAYAEHKKSLKRQELLTGECTGITQISFEKFKKEHLASIQTTLSQGSYYEHEHTLDVFCQACGPKDLTVIDFQMLEKFRTARLEAGNSAATINKYLRNLQSALQRAVKRGYIRQNPFTGNRKALFIREDEPAPVVLEPQEFKKLLSVCLDDRWRAICSLAYYAGLRIGEILALQWKDIDFDDRLLFVCNKPDHRTKSRKNRHIPMDKQLVELLQHMRLSMFKSELVITSDNLGGKKMHNNVCRDFAAIMLRARLVVEVKNAKDPDGKLIDAPKCTIHDLRNTFVTDMLASGTDPKSVQALVGHANIQTTMKYYAAVRAKSLTAAIDRRTQLIA